MDILVDIGRWIWIDVIRREGRYLKIDKSWIEYLDGKVDTYIDEQSDRWIDK